MWWMLGTAGQRSPAAPSAIGNSRLSPGKRHRGQPTAAPSFGRVHCDVFRSENRRQAADTHKRAACQSLRQLEWGPLVATSSRWCLPSLRRHLSEWWHCSRWGALRRLYRVEGDVKVAHGGFGLVLISDQTQGIPHHGDPYPTRMHLDITRAGRLSEGRAKKRCRMKARQLVTEERHRFWRNDDAGDHASVAQVAVVPMQCQFGQAVCISSNFCKGGSILWNSPR